MFLSACCVPVRMKSSRFVPLLNHHRKYNVEVAPMPSFVGTVTKTSGDEDVLYSDFQTYAIGSSDGRLGSGRAGFFGGAYLKGIGLTPLAANWNMPDDRYHGSGHLSASAAAREYLVTKFAERRGLLDLIVPCEGVLAAPLDPALVEFDRGLAHLSERPACDVALQAISVKPARFARWSNFFWLLDRMPIESDDPQRTVSPARFLRLLAEFLEPTTGGGGGRGVDGAMSAADLVARIRRAAFATLDAFERFFAEGISWCSVGGNFTMDGRFLDLEIPIVVGCPFVGGFDIGLPRVIHVGFDWLVAAQELRLILRSLQNRLKRFALDAALKDDIASFIDEVVEGLTELLTEPHSPLSGEDDAAVHGFVAMVDRVSALTPTGRERVTEMARRRSTDRGCAHALPTVVLHQVSNEPAVIGDVRTITGIFANDRGLTPTPDAQCFWSGLATVDRTRTVDDYLARLDEAATALLSTPATTT